MMKNAGPVCQKNASQFTTCQKRILIGDFDDKAKKMKIAMCNKLLQKNNITKYIIVTLFNFKDAFSYISPPVKPSISIFCSDQN